MKKARCGAGLGDSLYLQGVLRVLSEKEPYAAMTDYPDVFRQLPNVITMPFDRIGVDIVAHYTRRKGVAGTNQWQDCCIAAGLPEDTPFKLTWKTRNKALVSKVAAAGKPILLVAMMRAPMGRKDGFGAEVLPSGAVIQKLIDKAVGKYTIVQVGSGRNLFQFKNIDIDLSNKTTVSDLIDLAKTCDKMLGYCSFFVPLAESLGKDALFVWSSAGLNSGIEFVRFIRPEKVLSSPQSRFVVDNWGAHDIERTADAFF
jgi:hypothetical protein